jgi:tRNA modification GTPase
MAQAHIDEATIAAIATPPGPGGIGIIRISGVAALPALARIFKPSSRSGRLVNRKMHHGWVVTPETGVPIDEVLAVYMQAPHTYTREDIVEIHCHGSYLVLQEILTLILSTGENLRLADPGEFTKRAFLNGRIDLTRAEAVIDLLQAKTREGREFASVQLGGRLHEMVMAIRDSLIAVRAILEVAIDFPDEEVEIIDQDSLARQLQTGVLAPLEALLALSEKGRIYRDGIAVVIVGRPNVGKSSLLNCLLREERAIVTPVPGTTRDTIEEFLDIKGIPVRIIDTAGIRETCEEVEEIGIRRARQKLSDADLVLFMIDGAEALEEADRSLFDSICGKSVIVVCNKMDLVPERDGSEYMQAFPGLPVVRISARTGAGLADLEKAVYNSVTDSDSGWDPGHECVPNLRHRVSLSGALAAAENARDGLLRQAAPDLLAVDLQSVLEHLGDIVGETTTEDILDTIFSRFCIGK